MNIENVNKAIVSLEQIDSNSDYAYEQALLAFGSIKQLPVLIYSIPQGTFLFRTRPHEGEDFFSQVSEIKTPPNWAVKNFARCNRPYQPVFYCSENRPTSFIELVEYLADTKEFGEELLVTIGRWELLKPLNLIIVTTPDQSKRVSEFDKYHGSSLDSFLEEQAGEAKEAASLFFTFMFEKFRKPAKNDLKTYVITTAYCNLALMHGAVGADGIYYPSVPFQLQGVNFAIKPGFIKDDNLRLMHAVRNKFRIDENEEGKHTFKEIESITTDNINDNVIIWE